jgi:hypothetical protein
MDLSMLSSGMLAQTPAAIPPAGVEPNLVNPETKGPIVITVGTPLLAIMLLFVGVRFYNKAIVRRKLTIDDCK